MSARGKVYTLDPRQFPPRSPRTDRPYVVMPAVIVGAPPSVPGTLAPTIGARR